MKIFANASDVMAARYFTAEPLRVQPERRSIASEILVFERFLILKKHIVHFPKLPLAAGRFRSFCRMFGVRMSIDQRKIAESKTQLLTQFFLKRFHDRMSLAAIRTFVIAIFNERDRCIHWPLDVIPIRR